MILYRALNKDDIYNYENGTHIYCSLFNSFRNKGKKNLKKKESRNLSRYVDLCLLKDRQYALDCIVGHVSGKRIGAGVSPWVSVSSDYEFVMGEYAVPQSGTYNYEKDRKPILVISIDDDEIKKDSDSIKCLRNSKEERIIIDLRNGLLKGYYESGAISSEKFNSDMPGYDYMACVKRDVNNMNTRIDGFSNYTMAANELVIFLGINRDDCMFMIYPLIQDIIYGLDEDIEKVLPSIIKNRDRIENILEKINDPFYKELYPTIHTGINLTDYLVKNYNSIEGNTIEEKYDYLKKKKLRLLNEIDNEINRELLSDFYATRVIDDKVLVTSYDNLGNIPKSLRHDIIMLEKNDKLYLYDNMSHCYTNSDSMIPKVEVIKLLKTK